MKATEKINSQIAALEILLGSVERKTKNLMTTRKNLLKRIERLKQGAKIVAVREEKQAEREAEIAKRHAEIEKRLRECLEMNGKI